MDDFNTESQQVDNEAPVVDMNTHTEIPTENELKVDSDVFNEAKDNVIKNDINTLNERTPKGPKYTR